MMQNFRLYNGCDALRFSANVLHDQVQAKKSGFLFLCLL